MSPRRKSPPPAAHAVERVSHYEELIRFESRILEQMDELASSLSEDGAGGGGGEQHRAPPRPHRRAPKAP